MIHRCTIRSPLLWLLVVCGFGGVAVQTASASFPQLTLILPRGVQRGGDRELVFRGARLKDAEELLFHTVFPAAAADQPNGFVVRRIEPIDDNSFKAVVFVPESCPLGEHLVQVRCKSGISEYRSFMVGGLPVVDEVEPNGSPAEAQKVGLNSTIHGVVKSEDVDYYAVTLAKGQRLSVDVEALRLGSHLFDPAIAIVDERRFELATSDDAAVAQQDAVLSLIAPADGTYYVQIRETSYAGDDNCRYRLHVGTFPRPTAIYPAGGKSGEKTSVTFLGDAAGPLQQEVQVPDASTQAIGSRMRLFASDAQGTAPSAIPFRVSAFGSFLESEPNNDVAAANTADVAQSFNGVIGADGDADCFRFGAKKGQVFDIECYARRLRSGLDPVIAVLQADGKSIAGNDDSRGPDSYLRFQVPGDGEYVVRITDHLGRGRPDFVYRLEFQAVEPAVAVSIPRIDRYSQTRQQIMVPRGNRYAVLVNATRTNMAGDLVLEAPRLPAGVTMHTQTMPAAVSQMPVVFESAPDAPVAGGLFDLVIRPADPAVTVRGHFENAADFVLGQPNNAVYYSGKVDKLAMAVIDPVPFRIDIVPPKAPLVRNGSMQLKVVVTRNEGYAQPITVEFPYRSPGIGAPPNITIPADKSEGLYAINADGNAALGTWPIYAIAQGEAGGAAWAASQLATLTVAEPFSTATLARASCEKGQAAQIVCALAHATPFEGEAVARLQGLPAETAAAELKFTKDTPQLVFEVRTTEKSPVGNHKTPFVELVTTVAGEPVVARGGQTELQIAEPAKAPPAAAAAAPAAAVTPPPTPQPVAAKPLSRLEKLRQQGKTSGAASN